jgi:hypothetical protein
VYPTVDETGDTAIDKYLYYPALIAMSAEMEATAVWHTMDA